MAKLLRQIARGLSIETHTPVSYWMDMPLDELAEWVAESVAAHNRKRW